MGAVVSEVSWGNIVKTDTNVKCGNMKQPLTRIQRILTGEIPRTAVGRQS